MTRTTILSLLLVLGLVTAACSGGAEDGSVASLGTDAGVTKVQSAETESIPGEEAVLAFVACLRDEGLDIDDPDIDAEGNLLAPSMHSIAAETLDMAAVHSAFDACRGFLDNVAFSLSSEDLTGREDELLAFAACMREYGYDMPDPDLSGDGHSGAGPFGDAIDTDDPDFLEAAKSCEGIVGG
jgi:hypothetical protein